MELARQLLGQICMCLPMRGGGSHRDRVIPGIGQRQYVVPRESWQGTGNWLSSHSADEGQGTGTRRGPWPGDMCWKTGSCAALVRNLGIKITCIFQVGNTSQILPGGRPCRQMPSCLQLPLAQIHRTMGTVLASSFLNIQGTQGAWLEVAPTQAALHSLDIPLQEEGWGGGGYVATHPLGSPGDLGWKKPTWHSSANQTGVQGSVLQRPVPTMVPADRGWGSALAPRSLHSSGPGHAAAPCCAAARLGPYVPAMPLRCCCQG